MTTTSPFAALPPRPDDAPPEHVYVVVETPRGSRNKLDYEPKHGVFGLKKAMPAGFIFPFDFGFVPNTVGGDGDPLDVLVLLDAPTYPGVLVEARLLGVLFETDQVQDEHGPRANDRLIAVATGSRRHAELRTLADVGNATLDEIEHFFRAYNAVLGKPVAMRGRGGPAEAAGVVDEGIRRSAAKR